MKHILITGVAGFIGFHVASRFLDDSIAVIGIDNINNYYDIRLKQARLEQLYKKNRFIFKKIDIQDRTDVENIFNEYSFDIVIHLAAQAGVRYSLENPHSYIYSNLVGFLNILEGCSHSNVKHLVYASSSSVYGANKKMPFSVHQNVDHPISLYAATKKSNELMAHTYSSLYNIPTTGLRFFTVYGPWGRPDMALFLFTKRIYNGEPIEVYNYGKMKRDFTYIDDIVEGVYRVTKKIPKPNTTLNTNELDPGTSFAPYKIYNIGNNKPVNLLTFISILEEEIGRKVKKKFLPLQLGDVPVTYADITDLRNAVGFRPKTSIREGIMQFLKWYKEYYKV